MSEHRSPCDRKNRNDKDNDNASTGTQETITNNENEKEESSILSTRGAFGIFPTLFKSLDTCLNYFMFNSIFDQTTCDTLDNSDQDSDSHEKEQEKLRKARCRLLQLSSLVTKTSNSEINLMKSIEGEDKMNHNGSSNNNRSCSYSHIVHYQQNYVWDCGLTCILMFIRYLKEIESGPSTQHQSYDNKKFTTEENLELTHLEKLQKQWMIEQLQTQSIWTIDLVMLLETIFNEAPPRLKLPKRKLQNGFEVQYLYCSNNLGVDKTYQSFKYYSHAFSNDEKRVNKLFTLAHKNNNIPMLKVSWIHIDFVIEIISRDNCIAIVLLDYSVLFRHKCTNNNKSNGKVESGGKHYGISNNNNNNNNNRSDDVCFSGHYVILCGISTNEKDITKAKECFVELNTSVDPSFCLVINDPGCSENYTYIPKDIFENCWRAKGTDSDILFLVVN